MRHVTFKWGLFFKLNMHNCLLHYSINLPRPNQFFFLCLQTTPLSSTVTIANSSQGPWQEKKKSNPPPESSGRSYLKTIRVFFEAPGRKAKDALLSWGCITGLAVLPDESRRWVGKEVVLQLIPAPKALCWFFHVWQLPHSSYNTITEQAMRSAFKGITNWEFSSYFHGVSWLLDTIFMQSPQSS